ncbi:hypothetical protein T492DRAFT_893316 [Pavlovales sp. CCMP2436]|nr:hypothetical protein T492DRAFT_893316 [Pavlovales sp. CCMP2436]
MLFGLGAPAFRAPAIARSTLLRASHGPQRWHATASPSAHSARACPLLAEGNDDDRFVAYFALFAIGGYTLILAYEFLRLKLGGEI